MHRAHRWSLPYPPSAIFHLVKASVIDSLFVHHVFPSSNCPLHEHVLSPHRGRLLLFHGRVFLCRSSWPPTDLSERNVQFAKEVCHLVAFLFFVWMLHGSTKVVVRAVALLSAKTKWSVANSQENDFQESNKHQTNNEKTPTTMQSPGECRGR